LKNEFKVKAKIWLYPGMAAWHFVSLSKKTAFEIDKLFSDLKRGWGSLPVLATIGKTTWKTSIFPDKKSGTYLLPLKSEVRKKENIKVNSTVKLSLRVLEG
jgi:hypothetical protein